MNSDYEPEPTEIWLIVFMGLMFFLWAISVLIIFTVS